MKEFLHSLPDGWTIYVWMVAAAGILIGVIVGLWWASRNYQFDEDIKYVVFDKDDESKMDPEEYAKAKEVHEYQSELRKEFLKEKARRREAKHAKR